MTDTKALEAELIQVAAVAVAIVEDLRYGAANIKLVVPGFPVFSTELAPMPRTVDVLNRVYEERDRQHDKWGPQHHHPAIWMAILAEEVGEAADQTPYSGPSHSERGYQANLLIDKLRKIEKAARKVLAADTEMLVISCAGGPLCGICRSAPCQKFRAHIK